MVLDYEVKLKLVAFTQQVLHGPMESADLPPLGAFDMIGKDRRRAWSALGKMTKEVGNYLTFSYVREVHSIILKQLFWYTQFLLKGTL